MQLSIIIVNYNVKYFLEQCLDSILASHINFTYEVIIVDNNSSDDSVSYIKNKFDQPNISFIVNNDNPGFAKANNQAIRLVKGEYILLLNPDTVLGENVLSHVCSFMDKNSKAGAVSVKMINGNGNFLAESKRGFPTPWASFCKLSGLASIFPTSPFFGQYNLKYLDEDKTHKVPILVGAFMMIRKTALDKTGYLDEAFFMYGEDIDLSYRILQAGYENYYLPEKIIHYKGESTDKSEKKYTDAFYGAMRIFFNKHYPHYGKLFSSLISAGISLRALISGFIDKSPDNDKDSRIITFDADEYSYEEIIERMDKNRDINTQFRIYNPKTGIILGARFAEKIS